MLVSPVSMVSMESFRTKLGEFQINWDAFISARRKVVGEDVREAIDLMHLLLCYNLPGLPGFIQGADVPGTDIHSLRGKDHLMGKYFPFAVKQGFLTRSLSRENIFFKFAAFSTYFDDSAFLFFVDDLEKPENLIDLFEKKIKAITDWMRVIFRRKFDFFIVSASKGIAIRNSTDSDKFFPQFRKDIFSFFLFTDFIPLGFHYFVCRKDGLKIKSMHPSWKGTLNKLSEERVFAITDITAFLPEPDNTTFLSFFIEWILSQKEISLGEALSLSIVVFSEHIAEGMISKRIDEKFNTPMCFYFSPTFFYTLALSVIDENFKDAMDRIFYFSVREKRHITMLGIQNYIETGGIKHLEKYLSEPSTCHINEYRRIVRDEQVVKDKLLAIINDLKETLNPSCRHFAKKIEEQFNLEKKYFSIISYPLSFPHLEYSFISIVFRKGLEHEWELNLVDDMENVQTVFRGSSFEELFLFIVLNKIAWKKGARFSGVPVNISSKAQKLFSSVDSWYSSDEKIFIGINYLEEEIQKNDYFFISSIEDILNTGEKQRSVIKKLTLFIKSESYGYVSNYSFAGECPVSEMISKTAGRKHSSNDSFRFSICQDTFMRPVQSKIESYYKKEIVLPYIIKENNKFSLIQENSVLIFDTMTELLEETGKRKLKKFSMDAAGLPLLPYQRMFEAKSESRTQVFYLGPETKEIDIFYKGIYSGSYTALGREKLKDALLSIYSFNSSLSLILKEESDFDMFAYKPEGDKKDSFTDIRPMVEFESQVSKKNGLGFEMGNDNVLKLIYRGDEVSASSVDELAHSFFKRYPGTVQNIDYCRQFPVAAIDASNIFKLKFAVEKKLAALYKGVT